MTLSIWISLHCNISTGYLFYLVSWGLAVGLTTSWPKMSSDWDKFKLLLRKNFIIQSRSKLQTALEILIPVAFCSVLVIIRSLVDITRYDNPIYYKGLQMDNLKTLEWVSRTYEKGRLSEGFSSTDAKMTFWSSTGPCFTLQRTLSWNISSQMRSRT